MNYEDLTETYWQQQKERVEQLRNRISQRPPIGDGRTVPNDDSLTLGDGRRMSMAIMFLDICGFSNRKMSTLEEQDLTLRVLNLFFTEMIRIAEEYGGNVEKNTGDGLLIYFKDGDGSPPENGAKRAVACALTMMAANEHLIRPILRATPTTEIDFRVTIDHGEVTIAKLGAARRFNSVAAVGSTANLASKMLRFASANEILLGDLAKRLLPSSWQERFAVQLPIDSGWIYRATNIQYPIFRYTGRWTKYI